MKKKKLREGMRRGLERVNFPLLKYESLPSGINEVHFRVLGFGQFRA